MSLTIFHGEHHVQSREALLRLRTELQNKHIPLRTFEAKTLSVEEFENILGTSSLFSDNSAVLIEELHSLPKSSRKTQLIKLLSQANTDDIHVLLWEKKKLTPTELKQFPQAKIQAFPLSSKMFAWINSLDKSPVKQQLTLLQATIIHDGAEFCFAMFTRQIRIWLDKTPEQSPRQQQLLQIHDQLVWADFKLKTGQSPIGLDQVLTKLVLELGDKR